MSDMLIRPMLYGLGSWAGEILWTATMGKLSGDIPWDCTGRSQFQIPGYTRLDYGPVWALMDLGLEPVHDFLVRLTPEIRRALGEQTPRTR